MPAAWRSSAATSTPAAALPWRDALRLLPQLLVLPDGFRVAEIVEGARAARDALVRIIRG